jgi:heme exporter protein D
VKSEVLHSVKKERNILSTIKQRKVNWISHILCKNCLLKHVIKRKDRSDGKTRKKKEVVTG